MDGVLEENGRERGAGKGAGWERRRTRPRTRARVHGRVRASERLDVGVGGGCGGEAQRRRHGEKREHGSGKAEVPKRGVGDGGEGWVGERCGRGRGTGGDKHTRPRTCAPKPESPAISVHLVRRSRTFAGTMSPPFVAAALAGNRGAARLRGAPAPFAAAARSGAAPTLSRGADGRSHRWRRLQTGGAARSRAASTPPPAARVRAASTWVAEAAYMRHWGERRASRQRPPCAAAAHAASMGARRPSRMLAAGSVHRIRPSRELRTITMTHIRWRGFFGQRGSGALAGSVLHVHRRPAVAC